MTKPITITWTCPECDRDTDVSVWPFIPARVSGPPEHCHPVEGARIEPQFCSNCDEPIDVGTALERASEEEQGAREAAAEAKADARREERL